MRRARKEDNESEIVSLASFAKKLCAHCVKDVLTQRARRWRQARKEDNESNIVSYMRPLRKTLRALRLNTTLPSTSNHTRNWDRDQTHWATPILRRAQW
jgi:hypothetical protein